MSTAFCQARLSCILWAWHNLTKSCQSGRLRIDGVGRLGDSAIVLQKIAGMARWPACPRSVAPVGQSRTRPGAGCERLLSASLDLVCGPAYRLWFASQEGFEKQYPHTVLDQYNINIMTAGSSLCTVRGSDSDLSAAVVNIDRQAWKSYAEVFIDRFDLRLEFTLPWCRRVRHQGFLGWGGQPWCHTQRHQNFLICFAHQLLEVGGLW